MSVFPTPANFITGKSLAVYMYDCVETVATSINVQACTGNNHMDGH